MKKILTLIILIVSITLMSYGAVYKIDKSGSMTNPNGQKIPKYNTPNNTNNDEVIFTKGQSEISTTNIGYSTDNRIQYTKQQIKQMVKDNQIYTKKEPNIDIESIAKKYNRDPNVEINKLAIKQKRPLNNGCEIVTFSNDSVYYPRCNTNNYEYYYFGYQSIENPYIVMVAYEKKIDKDRIVQYLYQKSSSKWKLISISVKYPNLQIVYAKTFGLFIENGYYIDNKHYDLDGNYLDERYVYKIH